MKQHWVERLTYWTADRVWTRDPGIIVLARVCLVLCQIRVWWLRLLLRSTPGGRALDDGE
jgi:hypothetical protein